MPGPCSTADLPRHGAAPDVRCASLFAFEDTYYLLSFSNHQHGTNIDQQVQGTMKY